MYKSSTQISLDTQLVMILLRFDGLLISISYEHKFDKLSRRVTPFVIHS